jgi:hypothetical protein
MDKFGVYSSQAKSASYPITHSPSSAPLCLDAESIRADFGRNPPMNSTSVIGSCRYFFMSLGGPSFVEEQQHTHYRAEWTRSRLMRSCPQALQRYSPDDRPAFWKVGAATSFCTPLNA